MTRQKMEYWVIPRKKNGEFLAAMESVLAVYGMPYDAQCPVICMDEQPVQLIEEVSQPIAATTAHPKRVDYEYKRAGSTNIFMFCEPKSGWREARVRQRKTKVDWAQEVAYVLDTYYEHHDHVILVCDNLSTHKPGAFYEAFNAEKARKYVEKIQFCYTPVHGSWLNIAESELSALTRQCLKGRRIGCEDKLRKEVGEWSRVINEKNRRVDWQMSLEDARYKLKHLYPVSL